MSAEPKPGAFKRYLSQREAERCENALEPACKCRCQGAKHGAGRIHRGGNFSVLPEDDPHYRPAMTKRQARKLLSDAGNHIIRAGYRSEDWTPRTQAADIIAEARRTL